VDVACAEDYQTAQGFVPGYQMLVLVYSGFFGWMWRWLFSV
jgi:hypothetical protein